MIEESQYDAAAARLLADRARLDAALAQWEEWLQAGAWPSGAALTAGDRLLLEKSITDIRLALEAL